MKISPVLALITQLSMNIDAIRFVCNIFNAIYCAFPLSNMSSLFFYNSNADGDKLHPCLNAELIKCLIFCMFEALCIYIMTNLMHWNISGLQYFAYSISPNLTKCFCIIYNRICLFFDLFMFLNSLFYCKYIVTA